MLFLLNVSRRFFCCLYRTQPHYFNSRTTHMHGWAINPCISPPPHGPLVVITHTGANLLSRHTGPRFCTTGSISYLPDSRCDRTRQEMEWIQAMTWERKVLLLLLRPAAPSPGRASEHMLPARGWGASSSEPSDHGAQAEPCLASGSLHSAHHNLTLFYLLVSSRSLQDVLVIIARSRS